MACLVSECELLWFLMCILQVMETGLSASGGEFSWLLMCTFLVTKTLVSEGEFPWLLVCNLLVTETMAHLSSESELA